MKTYELKYPVTWDGKVVESIELARPKMKQVKRLNGDPTLQDLMNIAASVSGLVPPFFDELDASDGLAIVDIINGFLLSSRETGKT